LQGVYDGGTTFSELMQHGDLGLGTFNALDGEMVALDGCFYQLRADGSATKVSPEQKTPFSVVTFFQPEKELAIEEPIVKTELLKLIEAATEANLFSAICIDGHFTGMKTRTVARQEKPYPPLTKATASQAVHEFPEVEGTLVGFRSPAYAQGLEVAGFHLRFIQKDRCAGGHALDFTVSKGSIKIATLHRLHIKLPQSPEFLRARTDCADVDQEIRTAEG
jgi:acetolactate decarboxylase